eukprot:scaffold201033_cov30-Tisochrysis_lutea.AAC.4
MRRGTKGWQPVASECFEQQCSQSRHRHRSARRLGWARTRHACSRDSTTMGGRLALSIPQAVRPARRRSSCPTYAERMVIRS